MYNFCIIFHPAVKPEGYTLFHGYAHLGAGLSCGLAGLGAGMAIGIVGDAGVRYDRAKYSTYLSIWYLLLLASCNY